MRHRIQRMWKHHKRRAIGSSGFVRGNQVLSGSNQMRRQNDPDIVHTELVLMGFNYLRLS